MAPLLLGVLEEFDGSLIGAFGCREIALDAVVLAGIGLAEEDAKDAAVALRERKLVEVRVFVSLGGEADTGFGLAVEEKHGFDALGAEPVADSPEDYARFVRAEYDRWGKLVRDARIKLD